MREDAALVDISLFMLLVKVGTGRDMNVAIHVGSFTGQDASVPRGGLGLRSICLDGHDRWLEVANDRLIWNVAMFYVNVLFWKEGPFFVVGMHASHHLIVLLRTLVTTRIFDHLLGCGQA